MRRIVLALVAVICLVSVAACKKKTPPVVRPTPPPAGSTTTAGRPPAPPEPVNEPTVVPPEPVRDERIASASLDDINKNSPLKPVFFEYDSDELSPVAQK